TLEALRGVYGASDVLSVQALGSLIDSYVHIMRFKEAIQLLHEMEAILAIDNEPDGEGFNGDTDAVLVAESKRCLLEAVLESVEHAQEDTQTEVPISMKAFKRFMEDFLRKNLESFDWAAVFTVWQTFLYPPLRNALQETLESV